jgi:TolB-like protein
MRIITSLLAVLVLGTSFAVADPVPAPASAQPLVLFVPLKQLSDTAGREWVAEAIQENLISEAARAGDRAQVLDKPAATSDSATALRDGRDAGASIVVFGSYQVVGDQIRVTAQACDVASGRMVAPIAATGDLRDLFKIEDLLAEQIRPALPRTTAATTPQIIYGTPDSAAVANPNDAVANPNPQTQGIYPYTAANPDAANYPNGYPASAYPYYYPDYDYSSAYPGYAYPYYYPYYGYGPVFYGGFYWGGGYRHYGGYYRGGGYGYGGYRGGGGFHAGISGSFRGGGGGGRGR